MLDVYKLQVIGHFFSDTDFRDGNMQNEYSILGRGAFFVKNCTIAALLLGEVIRISADLRKLTMIQVKIGE